MLLTPSTQPAAPAPVPVADLERSLERMGGDQALLRDMAGFFIEDAPLLLEQLRESLDRGDTQGIAFAAHSLKGLAASFDASLLQDVTRRIEDHADRGDLSEVDAEFATLEGHAATLIQVLKEKLLV